MISVPGHDGVDFEHERELADKGRARLERTRQYWERTVDAYRVHVVIDGQRWLMDNLTVVEPTSPDLRALAHDVSYGTAALFTFRRFPERNRWHLMGAERELTGEAPPEGCTQFDWRRAFWLAWAIQDTEVLALLADVPPDDIVAREAYDRPLVTAIQSLYRRAPTTGRDIVHALECADPERVVSTHPDWVLDIIVPLIECLVPLADRDRAGLSAKLQKLLELRRDYQARVLRGQSGGPAPYLADEVVGLLGWARFLGIRIDVESPYVPAALT